MLLPGMGNVANFCLSFPGGLPLPPLCVWYQHFENITEKQLNKKSYKSIAQAQLLLAF